MLPGNVGEKDDFGTGLFIGMGGCIIAGAVFELISRLTAGKQMYIRRKNGKLIKH